MPKSFTSARLWSLVAALGLVAGTVTALGHGSTEPAAWHATLYLAAI